MKCPACANLDNRVVDSRLSKEGNVIRRRRECQACEWRFTTYERIEESVPWVVKKDGRREPFDRGKLLVGIEKACEKRPIALSTIEAMVREIEKTLCDRGEKEVVSQIIGEQVMQALYAIDEVAYVRFASVYRSFKDITEFMHEIHELLEEKPSRKFSTWTVVAAVAGLAVHVENFKEGARAMKCPVCANLDNRVVDSRLKDRLDDECSALVETVLQPHHLTSALIVGEINHIEGFVQDQLLTFREFVMLELRVHIDL